MAKPRNSTLIIKYVRYDDRPTSIVLEQAFWEFLGEIATEKRAPISQLVSAINSTKGKGFPSPLLFECLWRSIIAVSLSLQSPDVLPFWTRPRSRLIFAAVVM